MKGTIRCENAVRNTDIRPSGEEIMFLSESCRDRTKKEESDQGIGPKE